MNIVKYHNDINKLKLGHFTENETDIFFSLLFKARVTNDDIIIMNFLELKTLANGDTHNKRFIKNILGLNSKLKSMNQTVEIEKGVYLTFSLFGDILTDTNKHILEIPINTNFKYLINDLMRDYTEIDLKQLVSLKGNYPKVLYRLLKQFETTKMYIVKIEEFRELMGVPATYQMFNIRQKVLNPSLEQLEQYFEGLKLEETKVGRNVSTLKFTWRTKKKKVESVENAEIIKYKPSLGEKELADHEQKYKALELEQETVIAVEKIKISKVDYENLYKKYLHEINQEPTPTNKKIFDTMNKSKYEIIEFETKEYIQTKIYTVEDIDESLLISKTGKKLVGSARQHKIKKILEELNKIVVD